MSRLALAALASGLLILLAGPPAVAGPAPGSASSIPDCRAPMKLVGKGAISLSLTCPYQGVGKVDLDADSALTHIRRSPAMTGESSADSQLECRVLERAAGTARCTGGLNFGSTASLRFKLRSDRCDARIRLSTRGGGPCGTVGGPCKKALIIRGRTLGAPAGC
jgi:hypothetical protein